MVFSSIEFIFLFLPLFFITYYLIPGSLRNTWMFVGSILFYTLGSINHPEYIVLFVLSILCNYFFERLVGKSKCRAWFVIGIGCNLLYLGIFKYVLQVLPVGISFYTFQAIAYLCDVWNKKCRPEKSFVKFGTYLSMFPQLIAGPIVQYSEVSEQIHKRKVSYHLLAQGLQCFVLGLGSKVLLANQIGILWRQLCIYLSDLF